MTIKPRIVALAIGCGLLFSVADATVRCLVLDEGSFWALLMLDVPAYAVYLRCVVLGGCLVGGLLVSGVVVRKERAGTALRESEERFRQVAENAREIIWEVDANGLCTYVSPGAEAILGYEPEEIVGKKHFYDLFHPENREELSRRARKILAAKAPFREFINRNIHRNGKAVWLSTSGTPILDKDGNLAGYRGSDADITKRMEAEEALRASEERYRSLFESSKDAVYVSTPQGRFVDINPAGVELFGYSSKAELLEADIGEALFADPQDRGLTVALLERNGFLKDHAVFCRTKAGRPLVLLETATVVRDESGAVVEYRGILRDVTTRTELEEQLRQSQKMEAVGTLASGIAHDFNNLLTAIFGYTALARRTLPEEHAAVQPLGMVEEAARQASGVTSALLTFSQKTIVAKSPVDLGAVVCQSLRLLRRVLPNSIETVCQVPQDEQIWVKGDSVQLQQILMNLAVNARDAMPDGGELHISVGRRCPDSSGVFGQIAARMGAQAVLVVKDTGVGMSEEVRSRVFEPFFTTKPRGQSTGLGLSVIHGIVCDHGGSINVESKPGRGTCVTVLLPAWEPLEAGGDSPETVQRGHGEVVLLIEGDDHIRSIMTSTLSAQGYQVAAVKDGAAAAAVMASRREAVQLVVLDLDLPGQSGLTCLSEIRRLQPDVIVIVVTGRLDAEYNRRLDAEEIVLCKPFQMADLSALVFRALSRPVVEKSLSC